MALHSITIWTDKGNNRWEEEVFEDVGHPSDHVRTSYRVWANRSGGPSASTSETRGRVDSETTSTWDATSGTVDDVKYYSPNGPSERDAASSPVLLRTSLAVMRDAKVLVL